LTPAQPEAPAAPAAVIQVLSGRPSAEELAALVAVLSAVGGGEASESETARSVWSDPAWRLTGPQRRSGGWRTSALPR
jgi:hypothetical protein